MRRLMTVGAFAVSMVTLSAQTVSAAAETIFDYIPSPLPDNVVSYSYESFGVAEAGDQISFSTNGNQTLDNAKVVVSSWACENGTGWAATNTVPCVTTPGSTFPVPITLYIYDPNDDPMSLIDTTMQTFNIPFRPSASEGCEPTVNGHGWGQDCLLGLAHIITFDLTGVVVPDEIVYGVAWNTASFGYDPIGNGAECGAVQYAGCDSSLLNLGIEGTAPPATGTDELPDGAWQNAAFAGSYCDGGTAGINVFRLDDGCWDGFNPLVRFSRFVAEGGGGGGGGTPPPPSSDCTITGTDAPETLTGTDGDDVICAKAGADTLRGKSGDDLEKGGKGADLLKGGPGNDALNGGPGYDTCKGGKGSDTFKNCEVKKGGG
jgi:RTX calcium-binding nonapeptide repeat (4 copies)